MAQRKKLTRPHKSSVIFQGRNARLDEYEALFDRLLICAAPVRREEVTKLGEKLWRSIPQDTQLELVHDVALTVAYVAAQALAQQSEETKR